ncbi:MAG TPA: 4-alpha-glucanotransferase, partial [Actinomycetota bacterium]|nr:4-alpha-glucanotransferase [Actinomycetota bacterium]
MASAHLALGIQEGYRDRLGRWRQTPVETLAALTEVLSSGEDPGGDEVVVMTPENPAALEGPALLVTEDGAEHEVLDRLPSDLPLGYHRLTDGSGRIKQLIVSPGRCHLPSRLRQWGWALQLYAARSQKSWGMGDLGDLRLLGRWSASLGAEVALINPLHAANPGPPQEPSPYFPSSRCFRNPLYLRIEDVPGASEVEGIGRLAAAGRELNSSRRIDRDEIYRLKLTALESIWERSGRGSAAALFDGIGGALRDFCVFMTLYEHHRGPPSVWENEHRHPRNPAVATFARNHSERVAFHGWVQSLIQDQLEAAARDLRLVLDFAIGVDPSGADAWMWQDSLMAGATIGAPPDQFNARGQDWGVLGFNPRRL